MKDKELIELGEVAFHKFKHSAGTGYKGFSEILISHIERMGYQITKKPDSEFEVGQMVECAPPSNGRYAEFEGEEVQVLGICECENGYVVTATHLTRGLVTMLEAGFKPIRTEEEKLLAEGLKVVPYEGESMHRKEVIEALIAAGWRPNNQ